MEKNKTICDCCKKELGYEDKYTDIELKKSGHKHCLKAYRLGADIAENLKGYSDFVHNASFAGKSRTELNEMFYRAGQNSIMDIIEPSMLQEKQILLTYECDYRVDVYKSERLYRLIIISGHLENYRWVIYKDFGERNEQIIGSSGYDYDFSSPDYALVDAKKFIIAELENESK